MVKEIFKDEELPTPDEELHSNDELPPTSEGEEENTIDEPPKEEPKKKGKHKKPITEQRRAQLAANLAKGRIRSIELRGKKKIEKQQIQLKDSVMTDDVKMQIYNEIKEKKEKDNISFQIKDLYKKLDYILSDKDKEQIKEIKKEIQQEVKEVKSEIKKKQVKKIDVDLSIDEEDDLPPKSPTHIHIPSKPIAIPQRTKHYSTIRGGYYYS